MSSCSSNPRSSNSSAPCSSNLVPSSASVSDAGCVVCANGTLKDASEIQFFHNKNDDLPMVIASHSALEGSATEASIQKGKALPSKICMSTHTSKPSMCVREAAESAVTMKKPSKKKCPVSGSPKSSCQPPKKSNVAVTAMSGDKTEQMDTEKEASIPHSKEELTADIRLVFRRDKTYRNPHTNKTVDGHWCMLCLSYLLDAVQSYQKEEMALSNPHAELEQYLSSGLEPKGLVDVNDHDSEETEVEIELELPDSEEM
ncbi:hypothetical protein BDQ17DRAFT_1335095 [Cyathus striatus]|nr:hypothetical protein BDQ17DRAFT_1335095 [Cyathus striatus]